MEINQSGPELALRWQRIEIFPMNDPLAEWNFSRSLCELSQWEAEFAQIAIAEYKKFMFLKSIFPEETLLPAQIVDTVWHLHLLYTRSYQELCTALGSEFIDHDPRHSRRFNQQEHLDRYFRTMELYQRVFGQEPPTFIWGPKPIQDFNSDDLLPSEPA